ncbi:hypothetical protein KCP75_22095 [Salmonella enterica subsp. enterica]|nr:hypothetical protein KCP75_22095 [Salmonella enterica subsp. enterica]
MRTIKAGAKKPTALAEINRWRGATQAALISGAWYVIGTVEHYVGSRDRVLSIASQTLLQYDQLATGG